MASRGACMLCFCPDKVAGTSSAARGGNATKDNRWPSHLLGHCLRASSSFNLETSTFYSIPRRLTLQQLMASIYAHMMVDRIQSNFPTDSTRIGKDLHQSSLLFTSLAGQPEWPAQAYHIIGSTRACMSLAGGLETSVPVSWRRAPNPECIDSSSHNAQP